MNLLLDNVVNHITGKTGIAIIRDILAGVPIGRAPLLSVGRAKVCVQAYAGQGSTTRNS